MSYPKNNRILVILFSFFYFSLSTSAQEFPVDTIQYMGGSDKRINFVFISDGYQESELELFKTDVEGIVNDIFNTSPFSKYRNYFNVFTINVPSNESGAKHPGNASDEPSGHPVLEVDNYFGSTFDFAGIHRLVVATNNFKINNVMAANFPNYDQVFILVNSSFYGGSGGNNALSTTHQSAGEIAIHEIGHSFADLADEYYAGDQFSRETANMTANNDPNTVRWKNWNNEQGVGVYQHCCGGNSANWYKPHQNCKMQALNSSFCPVCQETFIETIHDLVSPVDSYSPTTAHIDLEGDQDILFHLNVVAPSPNSLTYSWQLNGEPIANLADSLNLSVSSLVGGDNTLSVRIIDNNDLSRSDNHPNVHEQIISWTLNKTLTSIETISNQQRVHLHVFPNPVTDQLMVEYEIENTSEIIIQLFDLHGRLLNSSPTFNQTPGTYEFPFSLSEYSSGTYLLRLKINGTYLDKKIIKN